MVTLWNSGKLSGSVGSSVVGVSSGEIIEKAHSLGTGNCIDNDCVRFNLKLFFLITRRRKVAHKTNTFIISHLGTAFSVQRNVYWEQT